jgi:hypothetical protein
MGFLIHSDLLSTQTKRLSQLRSFLHTQYCQE